MPTIALCADDYAQHAGIDDAVCELLARGRLTSVSCLTEMARWPAHSAPRLREQPGEAGVHLNLTHGGMPLPLAILGACLHVLGAARVRERFARQLDGFEAAMGRAPDFVDGHHHVHQLPQVRELLLDLLRSRYGAHRPWIRNTRPLAGAAGIKPAVLAALGGNALARQLEREGWPTNAGFGGVYGLQPGPFKSLMSGWLGTAIDGTLLMCHPANAAPASDPIGPARVAEYHFLASEDFGHLLEARNIRLSPLSSGLPAP